MSYLAQWIPTLVAVAILAIAALVLEALIRAERRRQAPHPRSPDIDKRDGVSPSVH